MNKTFIRPDKGKKFPVHRALAWCLREEERLGNSFVPFSDGDISIFLLERPFHRMELNDFVLANQNEISTWSITDAMTDAEIRGRLETDTPFPSRTGSWSTDLSQFHLELSAPNYYGKGVDERIWSPVPDMYGSVDGLSRMLPKPICDALRHLEALGNEIEVVDDWSPSFFKITLRRPFDFEDAATRLSDCADWNVRAFAIQDPHYELMNGFDVSNKDDTLLASPDGHPIAKRVIVGYLSTLSV